jgi:hypothetical protein
MNPLDFVMLTPLTAQIAGRPEIVVELIDGPVAVSHPDLVQTHIREIPRRLAGTCVSASSTACCHGTFLAGILGARRQCPRRPSMPQRLSVMRRMRR